MCVLRGAPARCAWRACVRGAACRTCLWCTWERRPMGCMVAEGHPRVPVRTRDKARLGLTTAGFGWVRTASVYSRSSASLSSLRPFFSSALPSVSVLVPFLASFVFVFSCSRVRDPTPCRSRSPPHRLHVAAFRSGPQLQLTRRWCVSTVNPSPKWRQLCRVASSRCVIFRCCCSRGCCRHACLTLCSAFDVP